MVPDGIKMAGSTSSAIYGAIKDLVVYFNNREKYIRCLREIFEQLSAQMVTVNSRIEQINRALEMSVSKVETEEY